MISIVLTSLYKSQENTDKDTVVRENIEFSDWTEDQVRTKLHEITWDSSASFRDKRHQTSAVSMNIEQHMLAVANWSLQTSTHTNQLKLLDVGCGNGILLKYVNIQASKVCSQWTDKNFYGVDLSSEMIKFAKKNYPKAHFTQTNFFNYQASESFTSITFNECFHYFVNPSDVIKKAISLLSKKGIILISHPRGFHNVELQRASSQLLVPKLLPSAEEVLSLANTYELDVLISPDVKSESYLTVLQLK